MSDLIYLFDKMIIIKEIIGIKTPKVSYLNKKPFLAQISGINNIPNNKSTFKKKAKAFNLN
jgi:hypothetical protein